ncbi:MAG: sulfotransferase [Nitrococcus sp.]|nr:sulfotransferase [Nitrococcus sp.]
MSPTGKLILKKVLWSITRYDGTRENKPICLFAQRRGGSTHLTQILSQNKGVRYYDEPFSFFGASCEQIRQLPPKEKSQFISLDEEEELVIQRYLNRIFCGKTDVSNPWRIWQSEFDFVFDRILLKILYAKPLIDWIAQRFSVDIVYYVRHPIPVALSIMEQGRGLNGRAYGWGDNSRAYLQDEVFISTYMNESLISYSWDIYKNGTFFERLILNWCLENLVPLRLKDLRPEWTFLSYEELVSDPTTCINYLSERLNLKDRSKMYKSVSIPSHSSKKLRTGNYSLADRDRLIFGWKAKVDQNMISSAAKILDKFEIDIYSVYDSTGKGALYHDSSPLLRSLG